jgi:ABC-type spermidine/putrescine transport system permease subunit I
VFPGDYGWSLGVAYGVTAAVVLALYPLCLWFARFKQRRADWWLGYL